MPEPLTIAAALIGKMIADSVIQQKKEREQREQRERDDAALRTYALPRLLPPSPLTRLLFPWNAVEAAQQPAPTVKAVATQQQEPKGVEKTAPNDGKAGGNNDSGNNDGNNGAANDAKAEEQKPEKPRRKSAATRRQKALNDLTDCFKYAPLCTTEERWQRLDQLFFVLRNNLGWIDPQTNRKHFLDLFLGEPTYNRVTWTGPMNALAYLFHELVNHRHILTMTGNQKLWQTVAARFHLKIQEKEQGRKKPVAYTVELTPDQLRKAKAPTKNGVQEDINQLCELLRPTRH